MNVGIGRVLDIREQTLRRYYRAELDKSGALSGLSVSTYSIPFSSHTKRTTRVYVERTEPIISGFITDVRPSQGSGGDA
jgi:hypothetical protein